MNNICVYFFFIVYEIFLPQIAYIQVLLITLYKSQGIDSDKEIIHSALNEDTLGSETCQNVNGFW